LGLSEKGGTPKLITETTGIDIPMIGPNRQALPLSVANAVRKEIIRGKLKSGDKLPTEQELAKLHGVSRVVIREAVARLRHEGLVMSRQGLGVFVTSPSSSNSLVLEPESLSGPEDFRALYELRLIMETGAAELAARHCDVADLVEIEQSLKDMGIVTDDEAAFLAADVRFHGAVSAASNNPFVVIFISFVAANLKESISVALTGLDLCSTARVSLREHEAVFDAIRARDPQGAGQAMKAHLENSARRLGLSVGG
jgi:DNA-binding FadR family transcriptional regulator